MIKQEHAKVSLGDRLRIDFNYTNYKGETSTRNCQVSYVYFGSNEFHSEPQWFLVGYDPTRSGPRHFAMKDMSEVKSV